MPALVIKKIEIRAVFAKSLRSLDYNNVFKQWTEWFFNLFLEASHIQYNRTIKIGKNNDGIQKPTGKVRKLYAIIFL